MAEQTELSGAGRGSGRQLAAGEEDAGRLDGASRWRLAAVVVALVLFAEAITFQQAMISNIVPKLAASFPQAGANVTWSIAVLGVAGGATMALVGKLGDLIGKKAGGADLRCPVRGRCLVCALTTTWALFLAGRALCGISLGLSAAEYGIVRDLMPRRWIPVTVGVIGTGLGFSAILGPIIAGWLTDAFSWRSVFWFLLIFIVAIIPVFMLAVPETPLRARQRLDVLGAALLGTGVGAALVYLSEGSSWGWGNIGCLAYLIGPCPAGGVRRLGTAGARADAGAVAAAHSPGADRDADRDADHRGHLDDLHRGRLHVRDTQGRAAQAADPGGRGGPVA